MVQKVTRRTDVNPTPNYSPMDAWQHTTRLVALTRDPGVFFISYVGRNYRMHACITYIPRPFGICTGLV